MNSKDNHDMIFAIEVCDEHISMKITFYYISFFKGKTNNILSRSNLRSLGIVNISFKNIGTDLTHVWGCIHLYIYIY